MTTAPIDREQAPLAGRRVLEAGASMAVAYAGRLLCDLGAEVVKLEPPEGDPLRQRPPFLGGEPGQERSAAAAYFHAEKCSVCSEPGDGIAERLLAAADVLLTDPSGEAAWFPPDRLAAERRRRPQLVVVDLSTYGRSGPLAGTPGGDLMALADSGFLSVVSTASSDPDPMPVRLPGELSSMFTGANGAITAAAALFQRERDGVGAQIEVSALEAMASTLATAYSSVTYAGEVPVHNGTRGVVPWAIFPCRNGEVLVQITEDSQWRALVKMLGDPEWGHLEVFATTAQRREQEDVVTSLVAEAMADQDADEFIAAAHVAGVAASKVNGAADVLAWEHLRAREYFRPIELADGASPVEVLAPTPPTRLDGRPLVGRRRLHRLGEDAGVVDAWAALEVPVSPTTAPPAVERPLAGVRVLDLTWVWAGPFSAMQLAHLGAEVIKVESSVRPDVTRILGPFPDEQPGPDRSGYFNQFNQGKKSVCLDLSSADGRAVLERLVRRADLVVDNMRAGALGRMGFPPERLWQLNPKVVAVSLTGFGETGPEKDRQAYGSIIDALAGINAIIGRPGGAATEVPLSLPDPGSGLHAALAMVAGLTLARRTGRGCRVETSMTEAWISAVPWGVLELSATGTERLPTGNRDDVAVPHGVFRCRGDYEWVALAVDDDEHFAALAEVIGRSELATDPRFATAAARRAHEDELEAVVTGWTSAQSRDEAVAELCRAGISARPVRRLDEVVDCPHLAARDFAPTLQHPAVGPRALPGVPWRADRWPRGVAGVAPVLGQHTDEVLHELGYDDEEIERLRQAGVLR